jgi:c-di-GMP-binding flagellar brake protein YcgR
MGKRIDLRLDIQLPVRIFGTDRTGATFSQKAITVNISRTGAQIAAVVPDLAVEEIIGLTYGVNRVHFRVKWIGKPGSPRAGHIGLLNIAPEKPLWEIPLPQSPSPDSFQPVRGERRQHPRFRCQNSVEIHVRDGATFWGTVADLSLGGCYMEMPIPIEAGTKVKVGIWLGQDKISAESEVAHKTGNVGIGLRFVEIAEPDLDKIRAFLSKLSPFARKPNLGANPVSKPSL